MIIQALFHRTILIVIIAGLLVARRGGTPAAPVTPVPTTPPAPATTPAATNTPVATATPTLRSGNGSEEVILKFINNTTGALKINWVNFDGEEEPLAEVAPMATQEVNSYSTHAWRIHGEAGNVVAEIIATAEKVQRFEIGADKNVAQQLCNPCKLSVAAGGNTGLGIPKMPDFMPSTGVVKAVVLFADFPDVPATQTPEEIFSLVSPGAETFYKDISYGRMDFTLEPHFVWLRLSQPSAHYAAGLHSFEGHRAFIQEAVDLAGPDVDFSGANLVLVMANPQAGALKIGPAFGSADPTNGIHADGVFIANGVTSGADLLNWDFLWLNHEAGHSMTLVDHYAYETDGTDADMFRFTGTFSLMGDIGGKAPEYFAFERWMLGWLDDDQIVCQQTNDETTTLSAIETEGGLKAVIVPTGPTTAVVVESRRALGYDSRLVKPGALVYSIDTSILPGQGPIKVLPVIDNDPYRDQSPLAAGESVTVGNVTIMVTASDPTHDTVQVTVAR